MAALGAFLDMKSESLKTVVSCLAFLGKCGAASVFQVAYILPTELFEPGERGKVFGAANVWGRIACILAPQAANVPPVALNTTLGAVALACCVLSLGLPETLRNSEASR